MRRNWLIAAIVIGIVAIAGAALIARLKEDDSESVSTSAWADSVCKSLASWSASISSLADVGGEKLTPESLGDKLDEAENATSQLVTELKDIGPPDLEAGDQLKQELDSATSELEASFETLKEGAEDAADAESPADFIQALAALAPQFQALLDAVSTTVDDLQNADVAEDAKAELEQAFADAPACQPLQADS